MAAGVAQAGKKVTIRDRDFILDMVRAEYGSLFEYEEVASLDWDQRTCTARMCAVHFIEH